MRTKRIDEIELYIREKKSVSLDTLCEVFNVIFFHGYIIQFHQFVSFSNPKRYRNS